MREKIKTCQFDCWDCNYCEAVVESHLKKGEDPGVEEYTQRTLDAIDNAILYDQTLSKKVILLEDSDSPQSKASTDNLCSHEDAVVSRR